MSESTNRDRQPPRTLLDTPDFAHLHPGTGVPATTNYPRNSQLQVPTSHLHHTGHNIAHFKHPQTFHQGVHQNLLKFHQPPSQGLTLQIQHFSTVQSVAQFQYHKDMAPFKNMDKPLPHYYAQPTEQYEIHNHQLPPAALELPGIGQAQPQSVQPVQNVETSNVSNQSIPININQTLTPSSTASVALQNGNLSNGVNQSIHPGIQSAGMVGMANNAQYYSGSLVNPIITQDLRSQSLPVTLNHLGQAPITGNHNHGAGAKFSDSDVELLHQLYSMGERHKWKQITKEINQRSASRRGDDPSGISDDERSTLSKNVSPTYVIKQYQNLLGLPRNLLYFGVLGLSIPYVVAEKGWDDLVDTESFSSPE